MASDMFSALERMLRRLVQLAVLLGILYVAFPDNSLRVTILLTWQLRDPKNLPRSLGGKFKILIT
jgi:hypothetical protein